MLIKENLFFIPKDSLLTVMIQKGEELNFSFDELIKYLEISPDKARAEKIYFESRYRIGLDNELEEIILEHPFSEAKNRLQTIKYEINKNLLDKISKDIDVAKKNTDKRSVAILMEEYTKINKEQASLNKEIN
jgi:hypothetical protein